MLIRELIAEVAAGWQVYRATPTGWILEPRKDGRKRRGFSAVIEHHAQFEIVAATTREQSRRPATHE
jgi:hypothetical protein